MQEKSDAELLRDYAAGDHEAAFRELISRHTGLVYSAALRQVGSPDLACDVAQSVFTDLALKAGSLAGKLRENSSLVGWLYRGTRFAARDLMRGDRRRLAHEREAMQELITNSELNAQWEEVRPVLDEAMAGLSDEDREALLLRYFKNEDLRTVGKALGVSDDAAQKRVSRAVERLRKFFAKRGVTVGASGLVVVISANAVQAAPLALAATISTAAVLAGTTVSTSTTIAATKIAAMTALQRSLVSGALVFAVGIGAFSTWRLWNAEDGPVSPVEITGELELVDYVQSATSGQYERRINHTFPFNCIVGSNEWRIVDRHFVGGRNESYFDGTNIYQASIVDQAITNAQPRIPSLAAGPVTPEQSKSNLTVYISPSPGGYPLSSLGEQIPWLAYCSGTYLRREQRVVPLPTALGRLADDSFAYADKVETFSDKLGLPRTIWLFTSKGQYQRGLHDPRMAKNGRSQRARINSIVPPYPDGILKFRYDVVSSTNFNGRNYPTEFSFTEYTADREGNWHPHVGGVGKLLSIRESPSQPRNVWDVSKRQMVIDYRFRHPTKFVDGIIYQWATAEVPSVDDPRLQAEFAKVVARAKDDPAAK
jgi:RNA polymerase sigma factor (sigma-70 family)